MKSSKIFMGARSINYAACVKVLKFRSENSRNASLNPKVKVTLNFKYVIDSINSHGVRSNSRSNQNEGKKMDLTAQQVDELIGQWLIVCLTEK
jgi:hypothetical protein